MAQIDELFQAAVGPYRALAGRAHRLRATARRLDLYLDLPRGARFPCAAGDQPACPVHDTEPKTWRHLDFFQHHAYLLDAVAWQRTRFGACWHG